MRQSRILKEKGIKSLDDFNDYMKEVSKEVLEVLSEGELTELLGYEKYDHKSKQTDNSRNGYSKKKVKSKFGNIDLDLPRDRKSEFDPRIVRKRQNDISGIEDMIISMYAKGMTVRDIKAHIEDIYGYELSHETISNMTSSVVEGAREWQQRPVNEIYSILFLDAVFMNMRLEGVIAKVAVYAILGIDLDGKKDCLGLYIAENESSKYWLTVLNELKNRGLKDVLIFSVDDLPGISDAIEASFPKSDIQKCIVHQIRNSMKHVSRKDRKEIAADLRAIYTSASEKAGYQALEAFASKWNKRYSYITESWKRNWAELTTFFKYPVEIKKLIYTTNPIESLNRCLKKISKNRSIFPNEDAIIKLFYLAIQDISKRWTKKKQENWSVIYTQLMIIFKDRLNLYI